MRHLTYLAVLAGCLLAALWVEPVLHVHVMRRWRRLAITLATAVVIFGGWDVAAVAAGHWRYDPAQTLRVRLFGQLPLEELLFFVVIPLAAILGFEAVRAVRGSAALAGDEVPDTGVVDEAYDQVGGLEHQEPGSGRPRDQRAERSGQALT
jgi:lycopene cyclase domain-containing protein